VPSREVRWASHLAELLARAGRDLEVRSELLERGVLGDRYHPEMESVHVLNADWLEVVVAQAGLPTVSEIGEAGFDALWMIVQHAISRPKFQRRMLAVFKNAEARGEIDPTRVAHLEDRVLVFEGKPQTFGTQSDWDEGGELSPFPIADPEKVDDRRRAVGLPSLRESLEALRFRAHSEGERAPVDRDRKKAEFEAWLVRVGWRAAQD
jgi:hypothetical protein